MTGENYTRFIRSDRNDKHLEKMLSDLANLRKKWGEIYHGNYEGNYWDALHSVEDKLNHLKHCIYSYVYNRATDYKQIEEFERKYLW